MQILWIMFTGIHLLNDVLTTDWKKLSNANSHLRNCDNTAKTVQIVSMILTIQERKCLQQKLTWMQSRLWVQSL